MKLLRVGELKKEIPAVLDKENKIIKIIIAPTSLLFALLIRRRLLIESFEFDILNYLLKFHLQ